MNTPPAPPRPALLIRVHLTDGSIESFAIEGEAQAEKAWSRIDPKRLFSQSRLVIAGTHSKSVFVTSEIVRLDFVQDCFGCWEFPESYSDVVELSESDFRKHAHLGEPELMPRRDQPTPVGDLFVSFLKLRFRQAQPIHLMVELSIKLPVENHSFMRFLLSKTAFHMRLTCGGVGLINLANLAGYTVYPGVAQVPVDSWLAEPVKEPESTD